MLPTSAMTCDVEDYFQVSAFESVVSRDSWLDFNCRIPRNVDIVLQRLSDHGAKATFFTLGWVAENYPKLVRRIVDEGHELASHGMEHRRVTSQSKSEFLADAGRSKKTLEDTSGKAVVGYRAASWSIDESTPWAHDVLAQCGYLYSSSVYPIRHDHYGMPNAQREPYQVRDLPICEIPASTIKLFGRNVPASGGGYFRLYPAAFSQFIIRRYHHSSSTPYVFYFHPWELDPDQPRVSGISSRARFRHYLNLERFEPRFRELLDTFRWDRMDRTFDRIIRANGG